MTARLLTASKRMVVVDFEIDMGDGKWNCLEKEGMQKSLLIKEMHNNKKGRTLQRTRSSSVSIFFKEECFNKDDRL